MKQPKTLATLALFATIASLAHTGHAQATSTASQPLQLSAFGGPTGTYTSFEGGKNGGLTLGADLTFLFTPYIKPSFELRGTAPVVSGHVDRQLNFLLGPKIEYPYHRLHPYADFLIGRGQISYLNGGYLYNDTLYLSSSSTVYSFGLGLDYDLTPRWGLKADFQLQHWDTPITNPYGVIYPKATTFGVVYHFDFNPAYHLRRSKPPADRETQPVPPSPQQP